MKSRDFETKCPCGFKVRGVMIKPTAMTPGVSKMNCLSCGSKFLLTTKLGRAGTFVPEFDIIELAPKAQEAMKKVIDERNKTIVGRDEPSGAALAQESS